MTATIATPGLTGGINPLDLKSSADSSSLAVKDSSGSQDRFLKLLVAQLNNQDPMNPMDNAQMTSQIAQINTVTGIQQLNETMKSMAAQMSSMQLMQGGNLVGHDVLIEGNRLAIDVKTQTALGAIELAGAASGVTIEVSTAGGKIIDSVSIGPQSSGQHGFTLDSSSWLADTPLQFRVIATNGTVPVSSTALMRDTVAAVGSGSGGLTLSLLGAGATPYGNVRAVL